VIGPLNEKESEKSNRITTALTADWQKPRRFAMRLPPAGYAERYAMRSIRM
jgi:hypothetical protein